MFDSENPVIQQMMSHRSIRKFKSDSIPQDVFEKIISCGLHSSSSGNMQTWSVIATTDEDTKKKLYEYHFEQPMILQVPVVLTFCADYYRMRRWVKLREADDSYDDLSGFLIGAFDAMIASQSIALAAESLGLGICYMGTTLWSADKITELLEIPETAYPVTSMVIGYPDEKPEVRDRLPLKAVLHQEKYWNPSDDEVLELYRKREIDGWNRYKSYGDLEEVEKAGITNLAQFYTSQFKYPKTLHAESSKMLFDLLKKQNFWNF